MIWLKRILIVAVLLAVAGGIAFALRPQPVLVDVAAIERGPMQVTVGEEGKTRVRDVYKVTAPVAGRTARSPHRVGDRVVEDETVITSIFPADPPFIDVRTRLELEASVAAAEAAVGQAAAEQASAQAELRVAESDLARTRQLSESGTVSPRALERALLDVDTARARVEEAGAALELRRSELRSAQARLLQPSGDRTSPDGDSCCVEVRAPVTGVVLDLPVESAQVVERGTLLAEIGSTSDLEIVADFLSTEAVRVAPGARAFITGWGGEPLEARVRRIEPAAFTKVSALGIEEQRVNIVLDLESQPEAFSRLGHGFRVYVDIVVWESEDAVQVPLGALFRNGGDWAVFVADGERAGLRPVTIGHRNADHAEVLEGLRPGERVILHPSDQVEAGVRISVREAEGRAAGAGDGT